MPEDRLTIRKSSKTRQENKTLCRSRHRLLTVATPAHDEGYSLGRSIIPTEPHCGHAGAARMFTSVAIAGPEAAYAPPAGSIAAYAALSTVWANAPWYPICKSQTMPMGYRSFGRTAHPRPARQPHPHTPRVTPTGYRRLGRTVLPHPAQQQRQHTPPVTPTPAGKA